MPSLTLIFGWPAAIASILLALGGIAAKRSTVVLVGAIVACPLLYYLFLTPRFQWVAPPVAVLLFLATLAVARGRPRTALLMVAPYVGLAMFLAWLVLDQDVVGMLEARQPVLVPPRVAGTEGETFQLIDLTDDFAEFYDLTSHLDPEDRTLAFHERFDTLFPGFYDADRIPYFTDAAYEAAIRNFIDRFPDHRTAYLSRAGRFARDINEAHADFLEHFPDLETLGPVYMLFSMGEFDGAVREIGGNRYLLFGVDVMDAAHSFDNERPFFQHELFHVYNDQFFSACDAIWCSLWAEGLAVAVAAELNPGATDAELLITEPEPLRAAIDAHLEEAVSAALAHFDSESEDDYGAFFGNGRLSPRLPPRFGYYLGYLAVQQALASGESSTTLAHLDSEQAREALARNLEVLVR